jgi:hypothetical protein
MRILHRYLTWDGHTKVIKPMKTVLDKFSIEYSYSEDPECVIPSYRHKLEFFLYEDDPRFVEIKSAVDKFKIIPQVVTAFDKEDFEKADWFQINAGEYQYPQPEEDSVVHHLLKHQIIKIENNCSQLAYYPRRYRPDVYCRYLSLYQACCF